MDGIFRGIKKSMLRHLSAYLLIIGIYYLPPLFLNPTGWLYFVSIAAWSWLSIGAYLKLIKLRCATILCCIELAISLCAIIALCEYLLLEQELFFYTNIELITDILVVLELIVITISLIGTMIGHLGMGWYNKRNIPDSDNRHNRC